MALHTRQDPPLTDILLTLMPEHCWMIWSFEKLTARYVETRHIPELLRRKRASNSSSQPTTDNSEPSSKNFEFLRLPNELQYLVIKALLDDSLFGFPLSPYGLPNRNAQLLLANTTRHLVSTCCNNIIEHVTRVLSGYVKGFRETQRRIQRNLEHRAYDSNLPSHHLLILILARRYCLIKRLEIERDVDFMKRMLTRVHNTRAMLTNQQ